MKRPLHHWLSNDDAFVAALNAGRTDLRRAAMARLEAMADKSLDVISAALDEGDAKVALRVLSGLGMLSGELPTIGPTDPAELAAERQGRETTANIAGCSGHRSTIASVLR